MSRGLFASAIGTSATSASALEREQRMPSLVLKMSVSLDGFVAPADGSTDWEAADRSADGASWTLQTVSNPGLRGASMIERRRQPRSRRSRRGHVHSGADR
jgi:hypothetical protein